MTREGHWTERKVYNDLNSEKSQQNWSRLERKTCKQESNRQPDADDQQVELIVGQMSLIAWVQALLSKREERKLEHDCDW